MHTIHRKHILYIPGVIINVFGIFFYFLTETRVHIRVSREVLFVICEMRGEIRMHSRNRCFKRYSEEYSGQRKGLFWNVFAL